MVTIIGLLAYHRFNNEAMSMDLVVIIGVAIIAKFVSMAYYRTN
jgi:hypothetical protein